MKNKIKDNKKLVLVIVVAMLLVMAIGATFAYFLSRSEISNTLNIVTNIENNNGTFIAQGSNIELNITSSSMQQSVSNNVAAENNTLLNVEYLSGTNTEIICSYDINYEWVSDNETNPYTKLGDKEFTYEIKDGENEIIKEETNFVASTDRLKHKVATEYISNSSISTPTKKQYTVNAKFYNLGIDQSINSNKNWNIKFYVDNVVCGLQGETYSFDNDNTTYEYTKGISDNLTFEVETPLSNFNPGGSVEVDNEVVNPSNYTATSGSTVITFNKNYVESLSDDEHNIKIKFNTGGYSETTFRVKQITSISLGEDVEIEKNESHTFTALVTPNNIDTSTIKWCSTSNTVINGVSSQGRCNNGEYEITSCYGNNTCIVTGVNDGNTTITARLANGSDSANLAVESSYVGDILNTRFLNLSVTSGGSNVGVSTISKNNEDGSVTLVSQGNTITTTYYTHWTKTSFMDVSDVKNLYIDANHSSTNATYQYSSLIPSSNFIIYDSNNTEIYHSTISGNKSIQTTINLSNINSICFYVDGYVPGSWAGYITFYNMDATR